MVNLKSNNQICYDKGKISSVNTGQFVKVNNCCIYWMSELWYMRMPEGRKEGIIMGWDVCVGMYGCSCGIYWIWLSFLYFYYIIITIILIILLYIITVLLYLYYMIINIMICIYCNYITSSYVYHLVLFRTIYYL